MIRVSMASIRCYKLLDSPGGIPGIDTAKEMTMGLTRPAMLALALLLPIAATPASAQQPRTLGIELNKLEPVANGCRAYLVFDNRTGSAFTEFKLDLVMFDGGGVIAKRMAVDPAPLPAEKTTVKLFDIQGVGCADLGQVLVNEVMACVDQSGARADCTKLIEATSRGAVAFVK
jgi:hypothetical protein